MPIQLEIVTPQKRLLSQSVDTVRAPGADGSFGVLPGHTPFVVALQPGALTHATGGRESHYFIGGGFAQVQNDRVIGGMTTRCAAAAADLYKVFLKGECVLTTARTAEMCKLTENSFRDVNIAFANELSVICGALDINVWEMIRLANRHPRVNILQPGPGVGGHCIAVDPWFIVSSAPEESRLITMARHVNDDKPRWVIDQVKAAVADCLRDNPDKSIRDVTVACYGLAFKADIDDLRESPALNIAHTLLDEHGGPVLLVEPNIRRLPEWLAKEKLVPLEHALREADIHVLLVDHAEFKRVRPQQGTIVDTRGTW